jgi:transketolase
MDARKLDTVELARRVRLHALAMNSAGGGSHTGSILSCADILAVLYGGAMQVSPPDPKAPWRDRFVLSKGHAAAGLYAVLAETGFLPLSELGTHYADGSRLCGHATHKVPGVEVSSGSLGHGLSMAAGMAYSARLRAGTHRVFCLLSDGECDEGSIWEAALFAGHHHLDHLVAIVDYNGLQGTGSVGDILNLEPFTDKWESFGWSVRAVDGHDHVALRAALTAVTSGRPRCIVARTVKGRGVSFMENSVLWHYRIPRGAELAAAVAEVEARA